MARLLQQAEKAAKTDASVLLLGETGVGKGLFAKTIHAMSARHQQKLIAVNCGGLPAALVESELFGHERGAFTNAVQRHIGRFEQANGSTLFLDEIGDMPLEAQRTLLKVLDEGHLTRVGGTDSIPIDVRIMAATNRDLPPGDCGKDVSGGLVPSFECGSVGGATAAAAAGGYSTVSGSFYAAVCPQSRPVHTEFERGGARLLARV